jgi:4-amino-4-deoxy-L-arabinose transferase-like glycosyltransferase
LKGLVLKSSSPPEQKADTLPGQNEKDRTVRHCLLICFITLAIYLPLIHGNPWNGNEPTRVAVAQDMLRTGNWIIPTLHGKLYLIKPPLMNWLIAASGMVFGGISEWTSRIPSVLAMLATGLTVYLMTRHWLNQDSRLCAAAATISMTGLLKKGMSAEIDSLFILFVTGILLFWLNGVIKNWKPVVVWGGSLFMVGVAFLTKGPHAAVFFYVTVVTYLLLRKRLSFFFTRGHAIGIFIAVAVLVFYLSAVLQEITPGNYLGMWKTQISSRGESSHTHGFVKHLLSYPPDVLMSFMPWILLVVPTLLIRSLRERASKLFNNELVVFSLIMIAANFPLYWLLPNAYVRYFLPAGPFVAIVIASILDSCLSERPEIRTYAMKIIRAIALLVLLVAPAIAGVALSKGMQLSLPLGLSVMLLLLSAGVHVFRPLSVSFRNIPVLIAVWVGLFSILFADLNIQRMVMRGESPKHAAQVIERLLPAGIPKVYEIGSRRILAVTCYLSHEIVELYEFGQLADISPDEHIYFLFDTDLLKNLNEHQKAFYHSMQWEKLSSSTFEKGDNEIVLGRLKIHG